jgi:flavin-dependent dehydrogenase
VSAPDLGPLASGATAVVIGGGPAGVATAIVLKRRARELGRDVRVVIVEGKRFAGEQHHNQCVGVLSPPIATLVEQELGVPFPRHLAQRTVGEYVLHTARHSIRLGGTAEPSLVLRRVQFDAYMLDAARERGVEVVTARASDLEFRAGRVVVYTESAPLEASVVVGAFGVDEGTAALFRRATGYRPPPTLSSVVTKCHPGESALASFGDGIHAFLPGSLPIEFGGITPKGNHLTINIAGADVDADLMEAFLARPEVRQALSAWDGTTRLDPGDLRCFKSRFPCGLARGYTGDRFVMVGDAAGLVRAFKGKGVTSAIQTGARAAHVLLEVGVSAEALRAFHAANRDIVGDIPFGRAMRHVTIWAARLGLMDLVLRAAQRDARLREALFDAVSAHRPYREVVRQVFSRASILALLAALRRHA